MLPVMRGRALAFVLLLLGPSPTLAEPPVLPHFDLSKMDPVLGQWFEQARAQAEALLEDDDVPKAGKAEAIGSLGETYYAFDLHEPALVCFELARSLAPEESKWQYLTGFVGSILGRSELARDAFEHAADDDDAPLPALVALADLHLSEGRAEAALPLYRRAIESPGGAAIGNLGVGRALAALGRSEEAVRHFRTALDLEPDASAIHYPLARALIALGRTEEAQRHLARRGDRNVPYPDPARDELSDVKALVAFQVVHSMAAEEETRPPEQILRFALSYLGDLKGTVEAFENVMQRSDLRAAPAQQRALLHYVTGGVALRQGSDASARKHLEEAVELDPALVEPRILLGNQLAREGDLEGAIEQFSHALEQRPDDTEILLKRATALLNAERTGEARADLERLLTVDPDHLQAAIRWAQVDEVDGRHAEADTRLQRLAESRPEGQDRLAVERAWAELERRRGNLPAAVKHLQQGLETAPNDTAARLELAHLLGGIGDLEAAEREFARVLAAWPRHPAALQGRVTALVLLERYREAVHLLDDALRQPETPLPLQIVLVRLLSAAPDADVRSPRRALDLARELTEGGEGTEPLVIDSLAMAEAAVGNFSRAAELLQQIMAQEAMPAGAESRIELYRQNRSFIASRPEDLLPPPS